MADHPTDDLALMALRYAAGDLPPPEAAAFEGRMAADHAAREALGEAIRLSAAALQQPAPAPDPLFREAVRETLRPTLLSRYFPRRPYRGHPLAWAGLGAVAAVALFVVGVALVEGDGGPATVRAPECPPVQPLPGSVLALDATSAATPMPAPADPARPAAAGSLATNVKTRTEPPVKLPDPDPGSADAGEGTAAGTTGPAIAADPPMADPGRTSPAPRDAQPGAPATLSAPSLILPGGEPDDDPGPTLTTSDS